MSAPPSLKRPYEDMVGFTVAVPHHYIRDEDEDDYEDTVHYKLYAFQGYKGESFADIFDEKTLKSLGIDGPYHLEYGPDAIQTIILSDKFDVYYFVNQYVAKSKEGATVVIVPHNQLWYKCVRLSQEEIDAAKSVVEGAVERAFKKQRT